MNKKYLSLSSSSSVFKPIPKTDNGDNADSENQQKQTCLMRITMMRTWTACVGIELEVGMFILRASFFYGLARAHRFAP